MYLGKGQQLKEADKPILGGQYLLADSVPEVKDRRGFSHLTTRPYRQTVMLSLILPCSPGPRKPQSPSLKRELGDSGRCRERCSSPRHGGESWGHRAVTQPCYSCKHCLVWGRGGGKTKTKSKRSIFQAFERSPGYRSHCVQIVNTPPPFTVRFCSQGSSGIRKLTLKSTCHVRLSPGRRVTGKRQNWPLRHKRGQERLSV